MNLVKKNHELKDVKKILATIKTGICEQNLFYAIVSYFIKRNISCKYFMIFLYKYILKNFFAEFNHNAIDIFFIKYVIDLYTAPKNYDSFNS